MSFRVHLFDTTVEDAWVNYNHEKLLQEITSIIDPSRVKSIIDVGCGGGLLFPPLISGFQNCEMFVGFDLSEDGSWSKIKSRNTYFLLASGERIPVKDRTFALVLCKDVLHHTKEEAAEIINELARISSRYVIIIEANRSNPIMRLFARAHDHYILEEVEGLLAVLGYNTKYTIGTCKAYPFYLPITQGVFIAREVPAHLVNITMAVVFGRLKFRWLARIILSFLSTVIKEPSFNIIIMTREESNVW